MPLGVSRCAAREGLLKAGKDAGSIVLEWILDQDKEKTPKDPTIRAKFDTYRFADYKDKAIDLPARVTTVGVETMKIVGAMKQAAR